MGRATTEREITRLEQLSRERELTERESYHLQKMINTQARQDRQSAALKARRG